MLLGFFTLTWLGSLFFNFVHWRRVGGNFVYVPRFSHLGAMIFGVCFIALGIYCLAALIGYADRDIGAQFTLAWLTWQCLYSVRARQRALPPRIVH